MEEFRNTHHIESTGDAIQIANKMFWSISVIEREGRWFVKGGEVVIFSTDNRENVDAFLYGLGLAYAVLPEPLFEHLRESIKELAGIEP